MAEYRYFEKESVKRFRRTVHRECRRLHLDPDDPEYPVMMVLACVLAFGTDVGVLSEVSGQQDKFVRDVLKRARKARILAGQTLRVGWNGEHGGMAMVLDAMVSAGTLSRFVDPKRSAAAKALVRKPETKPRRQRTKIAAGSVFSPKVTASDPLYGLNEWKKP